jgi:hypothetical protein
METMPSDLTRFEKRDVREKMLEFPYGVLPALQV